jgi:predicted nicotinamide N-methyase
MENSESRGASRAGYHPLAVMTFPEDFDLVTEQVRVAEFELMITRPRSAEDLIDEAEYADDERLPYWADLWPSGLALAAELAEGDIAGARILELGAGLALPSLVALARGARPLVTDWYPVALAFARANAAAAGLGELDTLEVDWSRPPDELVARGPFDLVIGADVAYEQRHAAPLARLLGEVAGDTTSIVIADPRRPDANALVNALSSAGWLHRRDERRVTGRPDEQGPVIYLHRFRRTG